jgi:hypothetical protein
MDLADLGTTVFVRTAPRTLELRWYSPLLFGAVNEILTRVVREIRASCGQPGDAGAFERLHRAFGTSLQSSHEFPACCEGDIRIFLDLVGRADLTVSQHCERTLSAARATALSAASVRIEPWHDELPALLAAQIPDRLSIEFTPDGVFFTFPRPRGFDNAVSAMMALVTALFGDRWRAAVDRGGTPIHARGIESLLRPALSHSGSEDEFFIGSEWLFGLRARPEGSNGSVGIAIAEDRLAEIDEWIRDHGAAWGLDMSAWMDFDSP